MRWAFSFFPTECIVLLTKRCARHHYIGIIFRRTSENALSLCRHMRTASAGCDVSSPLFTTQPPKFSIVLDESEGSDFAATTRPRKNIAVLASGSQSYNLVANSVLSDENHDYTADSRLHSLLSLFQACHSIIVVIMSN